MRDTVRAITELPCKCGGTIDRKVLECSGCDMPEPSSWEAAKAAARREHDR